MFNKRLRRQLIFMAVTFLIILPLSIFVGRSIPDGALDGAFSGWTWEDALTTGVGAWMIICVPISVVRWIAVPNARYGQSLTVPLAVMVAGGLALVLPVLGRGLLDPALVFGLLVVLFAAMCVLQLIQHNRSDELMRRYAADSTVISCNVLVAAFSLYAGGERLGVIPTVSPWGLVGIASIVQFAVAMYVYYRLGMDPDAQETPAT